MKNTRPGEQDEENDDVLTGEPGRKAPCVPSFVAQAQEAEEDSETEELKMPRPHRRGGESKETFDENLVGCAFPLLKNRTDR